MLSDIKKLFILFILGGFILTIVSALSCFTKNIYAAIVWAYPFSLVPTLYYLHYEGKTKEYISDYIIKTNIAIVILAFCLLFFVLYNKTKTFNNIYILYIYFIYNFMYPFFKIS